MADGRSSSSCPLLHSTSMVGTASSEATHGCRTAARAGSSSIHTAAGLSAESLGTAQVDCGCPAGHRCSRAGKPLGGSGGGGGGRGCCARESAGSDAAHSKGNE